MMERGWESARVHLQMRLGMMQGYENVAWEVSST